jgi:hypothetical protein
MLFIPVSFSKKHLFFLVGLTKTPEHLLVRTDSRMQTLDAFIVPAQPSSQHQQSSETQSTLSHEPLGNTTDNVDTTEPGEGGMTMMNTDSEERRVSKKRQRVLVDVNLTSVLELREEIKRNMHRGISLLFLATLLPIISCYPDLPHPLSNLS